MSSVRYKIFGCSGTFAALGLGTIAGIFVGLPLIITKNESGFLPILLFPILSVAIWQAIRNRNAKSTTDVPEEIEEKGKAIPHVDRLVLAVFVFVATPVVVGVLAWRRGIALKLHPADITIDINNYSNFGLWIGLLVAIPLTVCAFFRD